MTPWFLQEAMEAQGVSPYELANPSRGMTSGNYAGMRTRFGHTSGNWDDMDAAQRMDAARAYNQSVAQQNQALEAQQSNFPSPEDQLVNAYRPQQSGPPSFAQIGDELMIGGKTVTRDLSDEAAMLGRDPDELAQTIYGDAKARAANSFRDYLSGNSPAGTTGRALIDDPRFQGLDPARQANIYQRAYGRTLDEDLQADQLGQAYGKPLTYSDISNLELRQKNQSKNLSRLSALSTMMGTRGQMFNIANGQYDPDAGGVKYPGEFGEELVARMTPEQHALIQREIQNAFFPQSLMQGGGQQQPVMGNPITQGEPANQPALNDATRQKLWELQLLRQKKALAEQEARRGAQPAPPVYPRNTQLDALDWSAVN
jgi:hypothetical protein